MYRVAHTHKYLASTYHTDTDVNTERSLQIRRVRVVIIILIILLRYIAQA